jgi:hypothetical protein
LNNRFLIGRILAIVCFMAVLTLHAQVNDAGLWTNITIEKKIIKDLDVVLTEEVRMYENITEVGSFFTDIGVEYSIYKGLRAGLFYRYINKRQLDNSYSQNHRFYADVAYKQKIKRFDISYRVRYQVQYKGYNTSETGHVPEWYFRQKIHFGYNTKSRFDPYMDAELWYFLNPEWSRFDNIRISAGVVTRITKHQSLDIGYIINKEFNVTDPITSYIILIGYKISF